MAKTPVKKAPKGDFSAYEDKDLKVSHIEDIIPEKAKKGFRIGNNVLWAAFALVLIIFIAYPFFGNIVTKEPSQTTTINGIKVSADGDPISAIKSMPQMHLSAKRLDDYDDSHDAINEIYVTLAQTSGQAIAGSKTLLVGIDKNEPAGITFGKDTIKVVGADGSSLWNAVWALTSTLQDLTIDSGGMDLYEVKDSFAGKKNIYFIQNLSDTCVNYGSIVSAEGDIFTSIGLKQAEYGALVTHIYSDGNLCWNATDLNESKFDCPKASPDDYVIWMTRGDSARLDISPDDMTFTYVSCSQVPLQSTIVADIIEPTRVSAIAGIVFPENSGSLSYGLEEF